METGTGYLLLFVLSYCRCLRRGPGFICTETPWEFLKVEPKQDNQINTPRQEQIKGDFSTLFGLYRKNHDELLENALLM